MTARKKRTADSERIAARGNRPADRAKSKATVGTEEFPTEDDVDPEDAARDRRYPGALEQYENEGGSAPRPVEDEAYVRPRMPSSGTLSSHGDTDELPVAEPGLPQQPEDFGRQFLSNATQQDNFESELRRHEIDQEAHAIGQVISEATLEASGQEGSDIPESMALEGNQNPDADLEPPPTDFDLLHDTVHESSLFDRRLEDVELGDTREQTHVESDDSNPELRNFEAEPDRELEVKETRKTLDHGRGGRPPAHASTYGRIPEPAKLSGSSPRRAVATGRSRRDARHAAHVIQTSRKAAKMVSELTGLEDFDQAMTALEVVASGITRRLTPAAAGDFLAQLPSELRERIVETFPSGPVLGLTRETIESELSRRLDIELSEASRIVSDTGTAIEQLVSEGEIADMRAQLPRDLQSIFSGEVAHRKP